MQNVVLLKDLHQVKRIEGETLSISFLWLRVLLHSDPTSLYFCDVHIAFHFTEYYGDNNSKHTSAAKTKTL